MSSTFKHVAFASALFLQGCSQAGDAAGSAEVEAFLNRSQAHGISLVDAKKELGAIRGETLVELLRGAETPKSGSVALLTGLLSEKGDQDAVSALVDFAKRAPLEPDMMATRDKEIVAVSARLVALESLGLVGGDQAIEALQQAASKDGASELGAEWLPFLADQNTGRENAIASIRGRAIRGLVYANASIAGDFAKDFFSEARAQYQPGDAASEHALNEAISSLAQNDLVDEIGLDERLELWGSDQRFERIAPYLKKYFDEVEPH